MTVNSKSEKNKNVLQLNIDTIEEILDMSVIGEVQMNLANSICIGHNEPCKSESHGENNHGIFCVTGNDSDFIDIDSIFEDDKMVI